MPVLLVHAAHPVKRVRLVVVGRRLVVADGLLDARLYANPLLVYPSQCHHRFRVAELLAFLVKLDDPAEVRVWLEHEGVRLKAESHGLPVLQELVLLAQLAVVDRFLPVLLLLLPGVRLPPHGLLGDPLLLLNLLFLLPHQLLVHLLLPHQLQLTVHLLDALT